MRNLIMAFAVFACLAGAACPASAIDLYPDRGAEGTKSQSLWRTALNEAAILRVRYALKLTEAQLKLWPGVAAALRSLPKESEINEAVARRLAPTLTPFLKTLDDRQKQVAMAYAEKAGLAQYAALF